MRKLLCLALLSALFPLVLPRADAEEIGPRAGLEIPAALKPLPAQPEVVQQAVADYLKRIDEIEQRAAQEKAAARAKLIAALGQQAGDFRSSLQQPAAGLIGAALVAGEPSGIAYHYEHGKMFPRELIWERFHKTTDGRLEPLDLSIALVGYVEVPQAMTVKISQAAGGVNGDHGTLFVGERQLGQVGDDLAKAEIYVLTLPAGVHAVRWVLTAGTFQNSLLKFEDPRTGELLRVFHDDAQRRQTGAAEAREGVEIAADPSEWLQSLGQSHWRWVPLATPE